MTATATPTDIPLTVAWERIRQAQLQLEEARGALNDAYADLAGAYCDHPNSTRWICDHCGQYTDPTADDLAVGAFWRDLCADADQQPETADLVAYRLWERSPRRWIRK